jgi:hypothetical protein
VKPQMRSIRARQMGRVLVAVMHQQSQGFLCHSPQTPSQHQAPPLYQPGTQTLKQSAGELGVCKQQSFWQSLSWTKSAHSARCQKQ